MNLTLDTLSLHNTQEGIPSIQLLSRSAFRQRSGWESIFYGLRHRDDTQGEWMGREESWEPGGVLRGRRRETCGSDRRMARRGGRTVSSWNMLDTMEAKESRFCCFWQVHEYNASVLYLPEIRPRTLRGSPAVLPFICQKPLSLFQMGSFTETLFRKPCFPVIIFLDR